jgi:hypothetical protein
MERREVASGALRRLAVALVVLLIQSMIMGSFAWVIGRILVGEDVLPRFIAWDASCQIVFLGMLMRVIWMMAHGRNGSEDDE